MEGKLEGDLPPRDVGREGGGPGREGVGLVREGEGDCPPQYAHQPSQDKSRKGRNSLLLLLITLELFLYG